MNKTPTPRTDAALRYCKTRNESGREDMAGYSVLGIQKIIVESKNLERELTAVTEQRDGLHELHNKNAARSKELLELCGTLREQLDKLAEALEKAKAVYTPSSKGEYQTGWHDAICWVGQQALQSLNQSQQ